MKYRIIVCLYKRGGVICFVKKKFVAFVGFLCVAMILVTSKLVNEQSDNAKINTINDTTQNTIKDANQDEEKPMEIKHTINTVVKKNMNC